jgi:hypothetical protein
MSYIIAFSGSHGVGKTSLVNKFDDALGYNNLNSPHKIFKEFNTGLYNMGFALNGKGYDFDEVMFSQEQAFYLGYNVIKYYLSREDDDRLIFMDRTAVDTYIYTNYFAKKMHKSKNYQSLLQDMHVKSLEISKKVRHILVPPFEDFEVISDRMSIVERDQVWQDFLSFFNIELNNKHSILQGKTTELRYREILEIIEQYHLQDSHKTINQAYPAYS